MRFRLVPAAWLALGLVCAPSEVCAEDVRATSEAAPEMRDVLFVLGAGDESVADPEALRAAVEAQLAGTHTRVTFVRFEGKPTTLREQVESARHLAASRDAMGIFWLEMAVDGDWLLYLAEPGADRILVRRLEVESASSGTEVVGVITGHSAEALASGRTIGMQPVDLPETTSLEPGKEISPFEELPAVPRRRAPVEPTPDVKRGLRIQTAYRGSTYSDQLPFQHGLAVGAHWITGTGPIAGLEFTTFGAATSESEFVTLQIERVGGGVHAGWRVSVDPFALETELGYQGEVVTRSVLATVGEIPAEAPRSRWQSAVGGALRGELGLTRALGIFAGVGGHLVLNNFESIAIIDGQQRAVSTPFALRVTARAGLVLWP